MSARGLKVNIREKKPHFFIAEHTVLAQSIVAGDIVPQGREVYVDISSGTDPDWKKEVLDQSFEQVQVYLQQQNIAYISIYHVCAQAPSNLVIDAQWEEQPKKMNLLLEDRVCFEPWVLKDVQKARYLESFAKELRNQGMEIRLLGNMDKHDKVVTDPLPGSIVKKNEFVIIRKE